MKPFQFYKVTRFPSLEPGESTKTHFQMTFSGEGEDVNTEVTLESPEFEGTLSLLRIQSQIKHETYGFIKTTIDSQRKKLDFTEYLEPVDFQAYYDPQKHIVIFQAPKKACRGVLGNLRKNASGVELVEMAIDFGKVLDLVDEYEGAWFRSVSTRVRAAGIHGEQIQEDGLFKKMLKDGGELSNVTVPWQIDGAVHKVMITSSGAILLIQDYRTNIGLELRIVMDVFENLISKVWEVKKTKKQADDSPIEP